IGDLDINKKYKLNVYGNGSFNFNHTTYLHLESKTTHVFIQTDKAMYKPSQTVMFRTIVVNEELKPIINQSVVIQIEDPNGNIIKNTNTKTNKSGIISQELNLSDQPILGDWRIIVDVDSTTEVKRFTVAEYILPEFSVDINSPSFVLESSQQFVVTVKANYTYGKPVKGDLNLTITSLYGIPDTVPDYPMDNCYEGRCMYENRVNGKLFTFQSKIKGEKDVEIETSHLFVDADMSWQIFDIQASVMDELTKKIYNSTRQLTVVEKKYRFELLKYKTFKIGFDYVNYVQVTYADNKPVENSDKPLKIRYGFGWNVDNMNPVFETIPVNGIAKIVLNTENLPKATTTEQSTCDRTQHHRMINRRPYSRHGENSVISINAFYDGVDANIGTIYEDKNECYTDFQILNEKYEKVYKVGDDVEFELTTDKTLKNFVYEVVTKKGVVIANRISEPILSRIAFKVKITTENAPKSNIVVHFFCNDQLIDKNIEILVDMEFKNNPIISLNTSESKPGKQIAIIIESKPKSSVAILGYDQRTFLLKSGNDIEKSTVISAVNKQVGCNGREDFGSCTVSYHNDRIIPFH
ncbi:CD109 antigen-like protein, partial [Leptotrombidium deliense]